MSQGDLYGLRDADRKGLEVGREGDCVLWAEIIPGWPFPSSPVPVSKQQLVRLPQRYHGGRVLQERE